VLPIGGLKEKMIAAHRGGITKVLIPKENEKDLADIPANVKRNVEIQVVEHVDEVLAAALALEYPGQFLHDGDHDFDEIYEVPRHERPVEVPAPPGVN
jgi:ATP-dependent Lon protease